MQGSTLKYRFPLYTFNFDIETLPLHLKECVVQHYVLIKILVQRPIDSHCSKSPLTCPSFVLSES